ncbi:MAG TPA: hypothetical protein VF549_04970 [Solirubrobacteraceae bacterium]|jgi:hypothetical protein
MSGLFNRLGSAFVAPARGGPDLRTVAPPASGVDRRPLPPSIAMLSRPDDAMVAAGAAGLALAARCRTSHALVAIWGAADRPIRAPATGPARRLAATLAARGHDATATGRLTVVRLAGALQEAAREADRAAAAAPEVPTAVVLAGARDAAADALLHAQDAALVALPAGSDDAVADLTVAGLVALGVEATVVELPPASPPARALAASGAALVPPLRAPFDAAIKGLGRRDR